MVKTNAMMETVIPPAVAREKAAKTEVGHERVLATTTTMSATFNSCWSCLLPMCTREKISQTDIKEEKQDLPIT